MNTPCYRLQISLVAAAALLLISASPAIGQQVIDVDPTPTASNPSDFVAVGTSMYFVAGYPDRALWIQDGSASPHRLADSPQQPFTLGSLDGNLLFGGYSADHGFELYRSNGTDVAMVSDLWQGPASALTPELPESIAFAGYLYFSADDGTTGYELYRTDGYSVEFVGDMNQGFDGFGNRSSRPANFVAGDAYIYFAATNLGFGTELYRSDGMSPIRFDLNDSTSSNPSAFFTHDGRVYFVAEIQDYGRELMRIGFSGPELAQDINPGSASSDPILPTTLGADVIFFADDGIGGREPWRLRDGVAAPIADIRIGSESSVMINPTDQTRPLAVGGFVYFAADNGLDGLELWRTDGISVEQVADLNLGAAGSNPVSFVAAGSNLYFSADAGLGPSLFMVDGGSVTDLGVKVLPAGSAGGIVFGPIDDPEIGVELATSGPGFQSTLDLAPGTRDASPGQLLHTGGRLFFAADRVGEERQLYVLDSDATITNVSGGALVYKDPTKLKQSSGEHIYFVAFDEQNGSEPWVATHESARLLADIFPGPDGSQTRSLTPVGDRVYFTALDGVFGREVWVADSSGARRVADIFPGSGDLEYHAPSDLTSFDGRLYFSHHNGLQRVLFSSDGLDATPIDGDKRNGPRNPSNFIVAGNNLYFVARSDDAGTELWKTDGQGAQRVSDIAAGAASSDPSNLTASGSRLFFTADDGINGRQVWVADDSSVTNVSDLPSGAATFSSFVVLGNDLFFLLAGNSQTPSLFRRREQSIELVAELPVSPAGEMVAFDGSLFFAGATAVHGSELWSVDPAGEIVTFDIIPGEVGSHPGNMVVSPERLYFVARDEEYGIELHYLTKGRETGVVGDAPTSSGKTSVRISAVEVFPNPAAGNAIVSLQMRASSAVRADLYDMLGRRLRIVLDAPVLDGTHGFRVDVSTLAAGTYLVVVRAGEEMHVQTLVVRP